MMNGYCIFFQVEGGNWGVSAAVSLLRQIAKQCTSIQAPEHPEDLSPDNDKDLRVWFACLPHKLCSPPLDWDIQLLAGC